MKRRVLFLIVLCGCSQNHKTHNLKVTDTTIYYDSMTLINESP